MKKLSFNKEEYGLNTASPISYETCFFGLGKDNEHMFCAYVFEHIYDEPGYLNAEGAVVCPLINGTKDLPKECVFASQEDAEAACQKHMDRFMAGLDDLAIPV